MILEEKYYFHFGGLQLCDSQFQLFGEVVMLLAHSNEWATLHGVVMACIRVLQ
ncbi:MAG: hypothetical protein R2779_04910 [Crocinitomicaceae bacterium]